MMFESKQLISLLVLINSPMINATKMPEELRDVTHSRDELSMWRLGDHRQKIEFLNRGKEAKMRKKYKVQKNTHLF